MSDQSGAPKGDDRLEHDMSKRDRDFWIAVGLWGAALVTIFGCGLYAFIEQSFWYGSIFTAVGLGGITYLTAHLKGRRLRPRVGAMALMLAATWGLIGYQMWYLPHQSVPSQNPPVPTAEIVKFTPAWLTPDRRSTFKMGVLSTVSATTGNLPSVRIETVAEPESANFARALVDMFRAA